MKWPDAQDFLQPATVTRDTGSHGRLAKCKEPSKTSMAFVSRFESCLSRLTTLPQWSYGSSVSGAGLISRPKITVVFASLKIHVLKPITGRKKIFVISPNRADGSADIGIERQGAFNSAMVIMRAVLLQSMYQVCTLDM